MTQPTAASRRSAAARLAGAGLLNAGGRRRAVRNGPGAYARLHLQPVRPGGARRGHAQSTLATVAVGMAALQVLLALWIYRRLPLAGGPPRPVRLAHRIVGFALFALTVPIAVHCLIA